MTDIEKAYHILLAVASDSIDLLEHGNVWDTRRLLPRRFSVPRKKPSRTMCRGPEPPSPTDVFCRPRRLASAPGAKRGETAYRRAKEKVREIIDFTNLLYIARFCLDRFRGWLWYKMG